MRNSKSSLWILVAESAILSSIPFLIQQTGILIVTAFVPLFFLDKYLEEQNNKHKFAYFYLAFLAFNAITTWWVWNASAIGAIAAIALNALQMAVIFSLFRIARKELKKLFKNRDLEVTICSLLFLIVTWTAWERIYYQIEISWPWLALGNALATSPQLAQWYEIFGTQGGTVWILLCNSAIFIFLDSKSGKSRKIAAISAAAIIAIPCICSTVRYYTYDEAKKDTVDIVVAQPNIDPYDKFGVTPQTEIDSRVLELFEEKITESTDYIITPETFTYSVNIDDPENHISINRYQDFLSRYPGTEMILGAMTYRNYTATLQPTRSARRGAGERSWYDAFNTVLVLDSDNIYGYYFKSKLVPGVERIPYAKYLSFLAPLFEKFGGSPSSYGTQEDMIPIKSGKGLTIAGIVCYESVYGDYCRKAAEKGADFLTVITNDGWWGNTPGHRQHLNFSKLRAIECRRDLVFAANTGISAVINQRGETVVKTPYWEETVFDATLYTNEKITVFAKHGDFVGRIMSNAFLILFFIFVLLKVFSISDRKSSSGRTV